MLENLIWIVLLVVGIPGGMIAGYFARKSWAIREAESVEAKSRALINEAKDKQKQILLEAKDKAIRVIDEAKKEAETRRGEVLHLQERLEKREALFDQKLLDLEERQQKLMDRANRLEQIKAEIQKIKDEQMAKLEKIAEMTRDQAKTVLLENTETRMKDELLSRIRKLQNQGEEELEKEAKNLLSAVIQRVASSHASEFVNPKPT